MKRFVPKNTAKKKVWWKGRWSGGMCWMKIGVKRKNWLKDDKVAEKNRNKGTHSILIRPLSSPSLFLRSLPPSYPHSCRVLSYFYSCAFLPLIFIRLFHLFLFLSLYCLAHLSLLSPYPSHLATHNLLLLMWLIFIPSIPLIQPLPWLTLPANIFLASTQWLASRPIIITQDRISSTTRLHWTFPHS